MAPREHAESIGQHGRMPGYTAVDLSKLPSPAIVEALDFETIFAAMLADLQARDPTFDALVESDPAYCILQVAAYRELNLRQRVNDTARAVMLAYATGADLDNLGALLGVTRLQLDPGDPGQSIPPTMESDVDFRHRITLAPEGFSVAGPEGAYIYHALSADSGVLDASATSPSPGEVVVTVLARAGDGTADQALLDAVSAALSADDVRPLTDHVTVQSATITNYSVVATIYTYAGPDAGVVIDASTARLNDYITSSRLLGRDVTLSGLYAALHSPGVQRVEMTSPSADVTVDSTHVANCTGITLTDGGVDE